MPCSGRRKRRETRGQPSGRWGDGEASGSGERQVILGENSMLSGAPILQAGGTNEEVADIESHLSTRPHHTMNERKDATKEARQGREYSICIMQYSILLSRKLYVFLRISGRGCQCFLTKRYDIPSSKGFVAPQSSKMQREPKWEFVIALG